MLLLLSRAELMASSVLHVETSLCCTWNSFSPVHLAVCQGLATTPTAEPFPCTLWCPSVQYVICQDLQLSGTGIMMILPHIRRPSCTVSSTDMGKYGLMTPFYVLINSCQAILVGSIACYTYRPCLLPGVSWFQEDTSCCMGDFSWWGWQTCWFLARTHCQLWWLRMLVHMTMYQQPEGLFKACVRCQRWITSAWCSIAGHAEEVHQGFLKREPVVCGPSQHGNKSQQGSPKTSCKPMLWPPSHFRLLCACEGSWGVCGLSPLSIWLFLGQESTKAIGWSISWDGGFSMWVIDS